LATSVIGGTVSELTGGKFANGAVTAAMAYAFGEMAASDDSGGDYYVDCTNGVCEDGSNIYGGDALAANWNPKDPTKVTFFEGGPIRLGRQPMGNVNSDFAAPLNHSPPGAGRGGAFNAAKRQSGIPTSQQPSRVSPNVDRRGNAQPGRTYEYDVSAPGGGTRTIRVRDDAGGHNYGSGNPQNRGSHFNDEAGNHYDY